MSRRKRTFSSGCLARSVRDDAPFFLVARFRRSSDMPASFSVEHIMAIRRRNIEEADGQKFNLTRYGERLDYHEQKRGGDEKSQKDRGGVRLHWRSSCSVQRAGRAGP